MIWLVVVVVMFFGLLWFCCLVVVRGFFCVTLCLLFDCLRFACLFKLCCLMFLLIVWLFGLCASINSVVWFLLLFDYCMFYCADLLTWVTCFIWLWLSVWVIGVCALVDCSGFRCCLALCFISLLCLDSVLGCLGNWLVFVFLIIWINCYLYVCCVTLLSWSLFWFVDSTDTSVLVLCYCVCLVALMVRYILLLG